MKRDKMSDISFSPKLESWLSEGHKVVVSVTGLRLKKPWHFIPFYLYSIPSIIQSKNSKGNLLTEVATINGVRHTFTIWQSQNQMNQFLYRKAHKRAIENFEKIATGKTLQYQTNEVPSNWSEVLKVWEQYATEYTPKASRSEESSLEDEIQDDSIKNS